MSEIRPVNFPSVNRPSNIKSNKSVNKPHEVFNPKVPNQEDGKRKESKKVFKVNHASQIKQYKLNQAPESGALKYYHPAKKKVKPLVKLGQIVDIKV